MMRMMMNIREKMGWVGDKGVKCLLVQQYFIQFISNNSMSYPPHQYKQLRQQSNHQHPVYPQQIPTIPINHHQHSPIHFTQSHTPPTEVYPHRIGTHSIPTTNNTKLSTYPLHSPTIHQQQIYPQYHQQTHRKNIAVKPQLAIRQAPPHLPPNTRVEYVPYEQRYIDYVEQRVRVPVQKVRNEYYQVEHIIDYMPVAKQQTVYVTEPQQAVSMRLQYIPVEQRIIHIKEQDVKQLRLNPTEILESNSYHLEHLPVTMNPIGRNSEQYQIEKPIELKPSKTNYVTSEGYDPNQRIREIDRVLAQSSRRQHIAMQPYGYRQPEPNYQSGIKILESIVGGVSNFIKKESNLQGENTMKSIGAGLGNLIKNQINNFNNNNTSFNNNSYQNNNQNTFEGIYSLADIIKKSNQNTSSNPEVDINQAPQNKKWLKKHSYEQSIHEQSISGRSINEQDQYKQNGQHILDSVARGIGDLIQGRPLSSGNSNYHGI